MQADTPHRQVKGRLRELRSALILDAAEKVLVEKGYYDTSMDEIAASAGIAKGTLYQHFPHKDDLVFALFERRLSQFEQAVQQAATAPVSARAKLERILLAVFQEQWEEHGPLLHMIYHHADMQRALLKQKEPLLQRLRRCEALIRDIIEEGKAAGAFDATLSTDLMRHTFMRSLWLSRSEQSLVRERLSPEELTRQIGHLLFDGFAPR